jgi:hypothetical protein
MILSLLLTCGSAAACLGAEPAHDKSSYSLINPTPRSLMRDMSTDRPDTTESPITVDAGHLQIEASVVDWRYDDRNSDDQETSALTFGAMNLKLGLLNNVDLQFVFDAYSRQRVKDEATGGVGHLDGFSDIQFRLKWNLAGSDGGDFALAIMPFLQLPTGSNDLTTDHVEGGLILPIGFDLAPGVGFTTMAEIDFVHDPDDRAYDIEFLHSASIGADLIGDLGGYIEYISVWSGDGDAQYQGLFGAGLTYALTEDLQLDLGANVGLTRSADDLNLFLGVSWRY